MITARVDGSGVQASSDAAVPWWSFGKTVLAAAALHLVAQGRLTLDEPVPQGSFTLRQLLQHRAGLRCYGGVRAYHDAVAAAEEPWPADEMLARAGAATLAYAPGQGWAYSNIGYLFVRTLIERDAGAPLGPALQQLVFGPMGIAGVTVADAPADLDATAWGNARGYDPRWVYHGLLVGPAGAAALLLHRLLAGDLVPAGLLAAMRDRHAVDGVQPGRPWRVTNYGLGLMIGQGDGAGEYVGHTGGGCGSVSAVYRLGCTGAAFARGDDPGPVEVRAMQIARGCP